MLGPAVSAYGTSNSIMEMKVRLAPAALVPQVFEHEL